MPLEALASSARVLPPEPSDGGGDDSEAEPEVEMLPSGIVGATPGLAQQLEAQTRRQSRESRRKSAGEEMLSHPPPISTGSRVRSASPTPGIGPQISSSPTVGEDEGASDAEHPAALPSRRGHISSLWRKAAVTAVEQSRMSKEDPSFTSRMRVRMSSCSCSMAQRQLQRKAGRTNARGMWKKAITAATEEHRSRASTRERSTLGSRGGARGSRAPVNPNDPLCLEAAYQRRMSATSLADEKWLESMVAGVGSLEGKKRFKEDSFLTEMFSTEELKYVILPYSTGRKTWDVLMILLVLYTAICLPVVLCFRSVNTPKWMSGLDISMDFLFIFDIVLNFFTAYVTKDAILEIQRKAIMKNYLVTWFPIDLVGSIPWELITLIGQAAAGGSGGFSGGVGSELQIVKILKTPKLLRLGRLFKMLARIEGAANIGRIMMLMFLFVLLLHWLSCLFYLISDMSSLGGELSWLTSSPVEGDPLYSELTMPAQYVRVYYSVFLMLMGDNALTRNQYETVFAIIVGVLGSCVNAIIFANVATLVAQLNQQSSTHQKKMDGVDAAMRSLNVEPSTARRIRDYYEYVWVRHRDHQGDHFIRTLPSQLRSRTSCMIHENKLRTCPLFTKGDRKFIAALATALVPEVYLPAEFIVVAGFVSRAMYFIARGRVQIIRRDRSGTNGMRIEETYDYFDETGLFTEQQHSMSARSITHTDLYKLQREQFEQIIKDFPAAGWLVASSAHRHMPGPQARMISKTIGELVGMPNVRQSQAEAVRRSMDDTGRRPSLEDLSEAAKATPLQAMQVAEEEAVADASCCFGRGATTPTAPAPQRPTLDL